jgi:hypothetical protein
MAIKSAQLCAIQIGFDDYIMPMADGLKLVALMTGAVKVKRRYDDCHKWEIEKPSDVHVQLVLVRHQDIVDPPARSRLAIAFDGGK